MGAELRKLRERAGMSAATAAGLLGSNHAQISNIEAGRHGVSADRVRTLARLYTCPDRELIEAPFQMTGGRTRGWWEDYRDILPAGMLDLAEVEHQATYVRVGPLPGSGQSVDYLGGSVPQLDTVQLDTDHGNELLHSEAYLVNYRSVLDRMEGYSLKPAASRGLIHRIAQSL
ncbi:helix-turn-helix transcriptional regulator [Streptomyces sparsogenes]|uniref:helix-turn-helix transcriptional regulator n=1 Tax=Streptomyces sparsogenes TaxID=67365 RepID=UPI0033F6D801